MIQAYDGLFVLMSLKCYHYRLKLLSAVISRDRFELHCLTRLVAVLSKSLSQYFLCDFIRHIVAIDLQYSGSSWALLIIHY